MTIKTEVMNSSELDLREIASDVVARAMEAGASAADAIAREGTEFSTVVRLGQVETLKEAGSRGLGLRVFLGRRTASTYSNDFTREGIERMIQGALELARVTSEDPFAGLPEPEQLGSLSGDLQLHVQLEQVEVRAGDIADQRGDHRLAIVVAGKQVSPGRFRRAAQPAPDISLERDEVDRHTAECPVLREALLDPFAEGALVRPPLARHPLVDE